MAAARPSRSGRPGHFAPLALEAVPRSTPRRRWHVEAGQLIAGLPRGNHEFWGIPFQIGDPWITIDERPLEIALPARAGKVIVAHACDLSMPVGPTDRHPGQTMDVGELLATYVLVDRDGLETRHPIRRRYEIGEVGVWWGQLAFGSRPHRADAVVPEGVAVTSPFFGFNQTGVLQGAFKTLNGPAPGSTWWLHMLDSQPERSDLRRLRIEPSGAALIALGGITLFFGSGNPLRHEPARIYRIPLPLDLKPDDARVAIDLGIVGRRVHLQPPLDQSDVSPDVVSRRGVLNGVENARANSVVVEIAAHPEAVVSVGRRRMPIGQLEVIGERQAWVSVSLVDEATGEPIAGRVNVRTREGVTLPPAGHSSRLNVGWFQDWSPDVRVDELDFAYVDGQFAIEAPPGPIYVTAARGHEFNPATMVLDTGAHGPLIVPLRRAFDRGAGWMTADTHVHFISPATALLEADAEDIDLVNLLATQWGDLFTNVGDLGSPGGFERRGRSVVVGTENRQHLLGHLLLLGGNGQPVHPLAAAGPEESAIGDPLWTGLGDWARRGRKRGSLAIAPHFPEPYAEVVAGALLGLLDAVELGLLGPAHDGMNLAAWYTLLNVGLRLGCVAGTDKMSAACALGGVRTYAATSGGPRTFETFASAVRAGRTVATNGPMISMTVDGLGMGETLVLPVQGGDVAIEIEVKSAIEIDLIELVSNGFVVGESRGSRRLSMTLAVHEPTWLAARVSGRRRAISSQWSNGVAAHTSPIYVCVGGRTRYDIDAAKHLEAVITGCLIWIDTLATVPPGDRLHRIRRTFTAALRRLRGRRPALGRRS